MRSIQSAVLVPLAGFVCLLVLGITTGFYWHERNADEQQLSKTIEGIQGTFQRILANDSALMEATIRAIQRIEPLASALEGGDRKGLQTLSGELFQELREKHRITHFYFTRPDRVNLLRVHQPARHGDTIQRHTTRLALEGGATATGLELGPLGTFTLRTVTPWFVDRQLIGFIELGEEIGHVVEAIRRLFQVEVYVFVPKRHLDRTGWEAGMRMLERPPRWDTFPEVVLMDPAVPEPPPFLADFARDNGGGEERIRRNLPLGEQRINLARLPIRNVMGQEQAFLVIQQDVTARHDDSRRLILMVVTASFLGGGALILLFRLLLERLERRLARAEKRENRLGRILDASLNEILVLEEPTLRIQGANQGALHNLGYTAEEIGELTPLALFPEYDPQRFAALLQPLREGTTPQLVFETAVLRKNRTLYPVDVHLQLFANEQPPVLVAVVQDITERKRHEEALLESETRFRSITASARDAIIMVDDQDTITYWNQAATRIFGHEAEEANGQKLHHLLAPRRFHEAAAKGMELFRKSGGGNILNRTIELVGVRKNGEEFPFELSTAGLIYHNRWCAIGILRDITRRKEAEQRLKLGSSVIQHALEGIIITDTRGIIQMVNPAFTAITGYGVGEVVGQNPRILHSERHDASFYREMWRTLGEVSSWQGEIWNRRKSGEVYPEWLSISAIRDEHGQVTNYVGIFSDITQRKAFERHMETLAFYDPLTAIPNRMLFNERLLQALKECTRNRQQLAVLYLDLDFFKQVNDTHGHKTGDLLLQEVAQRLQGLLRKEDTVARLGGDEFAILLRTVHKPEDATLVAGKIIEALTRPFLLQGIECRIGTSIGITLFPQGATEAETLLKQADTAMYFAKKGGRNRYRLYGEDS